MGLSSIRPDTLEINLLSQIEAVIQNLHVSKPDLLQVRRLRVKTGAKVIFR